VTSGEAKALIKS